MYRKAYKQHVKSKGET
jgi:delta 1-pyrroline-5-carboxylate dehydrogenase